MLRTKMLSQGGKFTTRMFVGKPVWIRHLNTNTEVPSPPKLSREEQEEFERLQKVANAEDTIKAYNKSVLENKGSTSNKESLEALRKTLEDKDDIGKISPEYTKTIPEFEGDVNPKTGEMGGPKQDPIRHGDWSFNGRVTDF